MSSVRSSRPLRPIASHAGVAARRRCVPVWLWLVVRVRPSTRCRASIQKIVYVHPPCAFAAYLGFVCTALGGALYLWRRDERLRPLRGLLGRGGRAVLHADDRHRADLGARDLGPLVVLGPAPHASPCCSSSSTSPTCCCGASPRAASARRASRRSTASPGSPSSRSTTSRSSWRAGAASTPRTSSAGASAPGCGLPFWLGVADGARRLRPPARAARRGGLAARAGRPRRARPGGGDAVGYVIAAYGARASAASALCARASRTGAQGVCASPCPASEKTERR